MVRLTVRAKPRAKKSQIVRAEGLIVEVSLAAPPVDGAANEELIALLAEVLGVRKRDLRLVLGASSRDKVVEVGVLEEREVTRRLGEAASSPSKAPRRGRPSR
jgi:uncharacterized protein (TIGR00251 family)